jgi:dTDP-4-amino-4,6-dideoxygalactose transaminase
MKPFEKPILVTRPYLPDLKEYQDGIAEIWDNQWLTNNGPVLLRYVKHLETFFGTPNVCAFNNGTLALQIALQGMKIQGEVITTPFTFVATAHCLVWNNIRPVFVDIDPITYTISPEAVEAAITPRTTAILAVHVFGNPCHLEKLQAIADKHHLALLYDAAHAFGVKMVDGKRETGDGGQGTVNSTQCSVNSVQCSVPRHPDLNPINPVEKDIGLFGDCSMFSLHSTKLYHSIEGGLLTFNNPAYKKTFEYLRNFGFENETEVMMVGTNAKMNEMQALMGDLMLPKVPEIIAKRKLLTQAYFDGLKDIPGIDLHSVVNSLQCSVFSTQPHDSRLPPCESLAYEPNFAYLPVEITPEYGLSRDALYEKLKTFNVFARRYFYPLLTDFSCYKATGYARGDGLEMAKGVADRIVTLPIYFDLEVDDASRICEMIKSFRKG